MRVIIALVSFFALLLVGALVAPQFVDWNKYKPQIIAQVEKATGLEVLLEGDLSLAVLPTPHVNIQNLTVVAPQKREFENLLTMKSADVSVALAPLFQKQIKVSSVTLVEPVIRLEILDDGTPSWQTAQLSPTQTDDTPDTQNAPAQTSDAQGNTLNSVALDSVKIEDGQLVYVDHRTDARYEVGDVDATLQADSLQGPFDLKGNVAYNGEKVTFDIETASLVENESVPVRLMLGVPSAQAQFVFDGVTTLSAPIDAQGQTNLSIGSYKEIVALLGSDASIPLTDELEFDSLVTANENSVQMDNLNLRYGDFVTNGKLAIQNIQSQNPVIMTGALKSSSILDLDKILSQSKSVSSGKPAPRPAGENESQSASSQTPGMPARSLTLPMKIDADVTVDVGGLRFNDNLYKGVFIDLNKKEGNAQAVFKIIEMPGQAQMNGNVSAAYGSSSVSPAGQVTYADPSITYDLQGQVGQVGTFLKALAPDADTKPISNAYNTAQFDLKGSFTGDVITVKDSTMKLDSLIIGLAGFYDPAPTGGRAKASIDASAGSINFDRFTPEQPKVEAAKPKTMIPTPQNTVSGAGKAASPQEAVEPLRSLSLPLDLAFDISLQEAIIQGMTLKGIRLVGDVTQNALQLENATVNDYAGATMSLKGTVANLETLTGLDLSGYLKTQNLPQLAEALELDIAALPADLKAVEATATGKGSLDALDFTTNVKALGGQLSASGAATHLMKTPEYKNLSVRVQHPDMVQAIQVVNPSFSGGTGLSQPVDFYTKLNSDGKVYTLTDMQASLGKTNFAGNIKIETGWDVIAASGTIKAGTIALDNLLGADTAASGSNGGGSTSSSSSGAAQSAGRWSSAPIDLGWMKSMNINLDISAERLTYGKWNFVNPSTKLRVADGSLSATNLNAGVFGGSATLTTEVRSDPVAIDLTTNMSDINLESLAGALSGSNRLKAAGSVSFNASVTASGASPQALINDLHGNADLKGSNVVIRGFDLAKLAQGLSVEQKLVTSLSNFAQGALSGGQTQFDTINGDYVIEKGIVRIGSMQMEGPAAIIDSTGFADLPQWFINVDNAISLKEVEDMEPLQVKIKGPIDNPTDTFGKNILEDYIQQKLQRKIGKELPDILGDDVSGKLQQFGILPGADGTTQKPSLNNLIKGLTGGNETSAPAAQPQAAPTPVAPQPEVTPEAAPVAPAPAEQTQPAPEPAPEPVAPVEEQPATPAPAPAPAPEPVPEPAPAEEATIAPAENNSPVEGTEAGQAEETQAAP
jgi:uncharacterized protein involved in outer membrane biogenesis